MKRFQYHLEAAHKRWAEIVKPGDIVIDATCGNGHDTLLLAKLALTESLGIVYAVDIQSQAIEMTRSYLQSHLSHELFKRVKFIKSCHSQFPKEIPSSSVKLIVYNLGYLPGGDKAFTTMLETTQQSINSAMELIQEGGLICITCYPGHAEGQKEEEALINFVSTLDSQKWECSHQRWVNRPKSPTLILMKKITLQMT